MTTTPVQKSSEAFERCDGANPWAHLQARLAQWQFKNFGSSSDEQLGLGIAEEAGEICHAILKRSQRIRGMADEDAYRELAGDGVADVVIYAMQLCTRLRLDFATVVAETAEIVMARDWKRTPSP